MALTLLPLGGCFRRASFAPGEAGTLSPPVAATPGSPVAGQHISAQIDIPPSPSSLMLWRDYDSGAVGYWSANEKGIQSTAILSGQAGFQYQASAAAKTADGKTILYLRDLSNANGAVVYWILNATATGVAQWGYVDLQSNIVPPAASLVAAVDIDGDGNPDLIFRDQQRGDVTYLLLDANQKLRGTGIITLPQYPDPHVWRFTGAVDIGGTGSPNLIFQNLNDGTVQAWVLNGTNYVGAGNFSGSGDSSRYYMIGTLPINGGGALLVWRDLQTGDGDL